MFRLLENLYKKNVGKTYLERNKTETRSKNEVSIFPIFLIEIST